MKDLQDFCRSFDGTFAADTIKQLETIYSELKSRSDDFVQAYNIQCPVGCGSCCEHFLPDISQAEALELAVFLLYIKKDGALIRRLEECGGQTEAPCPLYRADTPFHCQAYAARPLICRLFGACANSDKNGNAVFRRCKFNPTDSMPEFLNIGDSRPAEMADFAIRINSISPDPTEFLPKAVTEAICKVQIIARAIGFVDNDDDDDTPNPTPTPLAS